MSHSVQLKPRPLRKPGLFFEVEAEVEHLTSKASWSTWLALATFRTACQRWPGTPITLRQGARVIEDSRHELLGLKG